MYSYSEVWYFISQVSLMFASQMSVNLNVKFYSVVLLDCQFNE